MTRDLLTIVVLAAISAVPGVAGEKLPKPLRDIGIDQNLNGQVPLDLVFRDETGKRIRLGDYFRDKPVVLVPAYYRCPRLCTLILNGVAEGLRQTSFEMGQDYRVVTFSFDPAETPAMAAEKKKRYVEFYGRPGAEENWHFLTGGPSSIRALTDAIGYRYTQDPETRLYAHASGIMVLTPGGVLSRYFYGVQYAPTDLRLGLVEASRGRIGSPVDQVRLFCFHYDPDTGKYTPAVMNLVRLGGVLTIVVMATVFGRLWFRSARASTLHLVPQNSD